MNAATITREEWDALKPGDVILWNGTKLRTVVDGPNHSGGGIFLSKLARGRYGPLTVYGWNDAKAKVMATGIRSRTVISTNEKLRIQDLGWNPRRAFVETLRKERELKQRMGRALCARKLVMP